MQAAIAAMCAAPTAAQARAVFDELGALGLASDTAAHTALLCAQARARDWEAALHTFRGMVEAGVPAVTATYNALLDACVQGARRSPL